MTVTVEPPPARAPDAGVIEEARARQRRHRGMAGAAALAAGATAAIVLAIAGGSGGSRPHSVFAPRAHPPSPATRQATAACAAATRKALQGAPSKALLAILGVLRRPATAADAIPQSLRLMGAASNAFVHYIRRTRAVDGGQYYIYPAILGGCGGHVRQGVMRLESHIDLAAGVLGATGGGGASAEDIERGQAIGAGPPGSSTSSTVTMIVPDGVAEVTLRYPAGRASGYSSKISPPFAITTAPVDNELVVSVPRSSGGGAIHQATIIWRAADGRIVKTFSRPY
jgi:hypothetical protein